MEDKVIGGEEVRDLKSESNGRTMCMDESAKKVMLKSVKVSQEKLGGSDPRIAGDSNRKDDSVPVLQHEIQS